MTQQVDSGQKWNTNGRKLAWNQRTQDAKGGVNSSFHWPLKNVLENIVQGLGPQFTAIKSAAVSETNKQTSKQNQAEYPPVYSKEFMFWFFLDSLQDDQCFGPWLSIFYCLCDLGEKGINFWS